jgi:hypothetical protein
MRRAPTTTLPDRKQVLFTFYWLQADHWEGKDFPVSISAEAQEGLVLLIF